MHVNYVQAVGAACKLHTNCTCTPEHLHVGRYERSSGGGEVEPWQRGVKDPGKNGIVQND